MPINFFLVYQNTFHTMQTRLTPDVSPDCCFRVSLWYPNLIFIISLSKIRREEVNPFFKKHNALQIIKRIWGFTTIHVPGMDNYGGSQVTSTNQNRDMFTKQTISWGAMGPSCIFFSFAHLEETSMEEPTPVKECSTSDTVSLPLTAHFS